MNAIILVLLIVVICLILSKYNTDKKSQIEQFTAFSGLNPLTSYDDYGTFNFLLHTDDEPYYDKGYASIFCGKPDYVPPLHPKLKGSVNPTASDSDLKVNFDFDSDSFISYQGFKVRRDLIPSNYNSADSGAMQAKADFGSGPDPDDSTWLINKMRPKESSKPPKPMNWYFDVRTKKYKPLF